MKKVNWNSFAKSAQQVKKNVKNTQLASEYLKDIPGECYMKDNISKNIVKISDCKSSSLRRYIKVLDNYFYLVSTKKDKDKILNKKIEIEKELNSRGDEGVI